MSLLAISVAVGLVLAFFLSIYPRQRIEVPLGWDTSHYLWQTTLVQDEGLSALDERLPNPYRASLARPAFPVVAAALSSLTGVQPIRLAWVLPTVLATILALAAGAFLTSALRRPLWQLLLVVVAFATSAYVVRLVAPEAYQDNLAAAALLIAAAIPLGMAVRGEPGGTIPAIALLAVAGVTHWVFFVFFVAVLGVCALLYLPRSWHAWRSGESLWRTPTGRLGLIATGSTVAAAGTLYGVLGAALQRPKLNEAEFNKKLREDLPLYRLSFMLPLAALGAALLGRRAAPSEAPEAADEDDARRRRFVLTLLAAWTAVAALGVLGYLLGMLVPAHRFMAFALSVPLLAVLALIGVTRWIGSRRGGSLLARGAAVAVAAAVVGTSAILSYARWTDQPGWARLERNKLEQAATASAYLDRIGLPDERPVVFVVDDRGPNPDAYVALMANMIRVALPSWRMDDTYLYLGTPENYLARRPTEIGRELYDPVSLRYLDALEPVLDEAPVTFITAALNDHSWGTWIAEHPDSRVGGEVAVLDRAPVSFHVDTPALPVGMVSPAKLGALGAGTLAGFGLVGIGWALLLFGRRLRSFELLAVAPALGLGAIVVVGIAFDRVGIRLHGASGAMVIPVAAAAAWAGVAWRAALSRRAARTEAS
jgi:hypothetical protein